MLKKCLKYDFKETFKLWWVGALTTLISSIPMAIVMNFMTRNEDPSVSDGTLLMIPLFLLAWLGMMVGIILSQGVIYVRYYRHFFGKEAYLTFTLPVKRSTLFASKFISGLCFNMVTYILFFVTIFLVMFLAEDGMGVYEAFGAGFAEGVESLIPAAVMIAAIVLIYGTILLVVSALNILTYYLVITFCGIYFKKYSLVAIIVALYLLSNFGAFLLIIPIMSCAVWASALVGLGTVGAITVGVVKTIVLAILVPALAIVVSAVIVMLLMFLNLELLERKLNIT